MLETLRVFIAVCSACLVGVTLYRARRGQSLERRADTLFGARKDALDELSALPPLAQRLIDALGGGEIDFGRESIGATATVIAVLLGLAWIFLGWEAALGIFGAAVIGYIFLIRWHQRRRIKQFTDRLHGFLERVRRLILIGNTFQQAFIQAAATADPIVKRNIDPVIRRVQHGAPFADSIDALAQRIDTIELHMLAAYVRTNAKFGGRVAQNLQNLIAQLGNKARLEREIKAATAETRASAVVLIGLTVFVMAVMAVLNRSYIDFFFASTTGNLILAGIFLWPLIGALVMKRILTMNF